MLTIDLGDVGDGHGHRYCREQRSHIMRLSARHPVYLQVGSLKVSTVMARVLSKSSTRLAIVGALLGGLLATAGTVFAGPLSQTPIQPAKLASAVPGPTFASDEERRDFEMKGADDANAREVEFRRDFIQSDGTFTTCRTPTYERRPPPTAPWPTLWSTPPRSSLARS